MIYTSQSFSIYKLQKQTYTVPLDHKVNSS